MKKQYIILILATAVIGFLIGLLTYSVRADSGWDSDYDSGWSSSDSDWGSSSWDSDSSWGSSSYGSSSSSSGGSTSPVSAFLFMLFIIAIVVIALESENRKKSGLGGHYNRSFPSITKHVLEQEIQQVIPDFNKKEFIDNAYQIFLDVQNAWMDFDYDTLRTKLSDELFNTYKSQLKALDAIKQKNIMSDFNRYDIDITEFEYNNNKLTIKVELIVSFYDYVVNNKNKIMRGRDDVKITNHYELTFISSVSQKDRPNKCPNCNAPLDNVASSTCPYCRSNIVSNTYDWVMSKKQIKR